MMKFKKKQATTAIKMSRKQQRKQLRKEKKVRRHEYYTNRNKPGKFFLNPDRNQIDAKQQKPTINASEMSTEQKLHKENNRKEKLGKEMRRQRSKQLKQANKDEDRNIRSLEKRLKLNKRKTKAIPKSFASDGLDYLLEVCDSENIEDAVNAEQQLSAIDDRFEEDFALITGKTDQKQTNSSDNIAENSSRKRKTDNKAGLTRKRTKLGAMSDESDVSESESELDFDESDESELNESEESIVKTVKTKKIERKGGVTRTKTQTNVSDDEFEVSASENLNESDFDFHETDDEAHLNIKRITSNDSDSDFETRKRHDGTWEDIYGRLRTKDGAVVEDKESEKYVPPAVRAKMAATGEVDNKRKLQLDRLRKQLKGLMNRLAESNMHSISTQIEHLYMSNSRNDMNYTLTNIMFETLTTSVATPERLLLEHVMLVAILHANVGTEIGAHFLQAVVKEFDRDFRAEKGVEDKSLDNLVHVLAQLYNFGIFHSQLLYGVLKLLSVRFTEKDVECVLRILRSVGFTLRKDDPLALKGLIQTLQKRATSVSEETKRANSRIKFMLDVLLAIKNNNVSKMPNYDTLYSEHLKKLLKGFIRKGNYVTQLNISLDDLLKAEERGKWWVVGSAWSGNAAQDNQSETEAKATTGYSKKLLELARKQRMNTDARRSVFCVIMSAEDYLDAFEKLSHLGLKNQQEREIIYVLLHCCLQEKTFNQYYALLVQKFCESDRKYQMTVKCSIWDKLKALNECSGIQISNLAKLLIHLFVEKSLPISTLKIVQFSELDNVTLRFVRQILLGILLHEDRESCIGVFEKVALSDKLKLFRESLRLFVHHFLLRNLKDGPIPEDQKKLLEDRAELVEKVLGAKDRKVL